jgi:pimeloyl-ACP methyl ester carboxylesterase
MLSVAAPDLQTRDLYTEVQGVRIHWAEVGEASGRPPVVLLHGLSDSHLSWSSIGRLLARDRRVMMPDLPGHGQSGRPDVAYDLEWYADVVARWIETVGIEEADIIGHSFGGGVAQMLLLACPDRIRRIVLVASGGLGTAIGWWLRLASVPWVVEHMGQPFMRLGTLMTLRGARREGTVRADLDELCQFNARPGSARAFARSVRAVIDWRGQRRLFFERMDELERIPPMLVLWGDSDELIPVAHGRAFADRLTEAALVTFEGCGHYLHHDRPEAFVLAVLRFLDSPRSDP